MRKNIYFTRVRRLAMTLVSVCMAATVAAQDKPDAPACLKADANYSRVTLSWQRSTYTPDTLLCEGFEGETFPPEGWTQTITNQNDASYTWFDFPTEEIAELIDDYTEYIHSGDHSAFVNFDMGAPYDDGTPGAQEEWLITPAVKGAAYIDFYSKLPAELAENAQIDDFPNHFYVKVSHDSGNTWQILWDGTTECNGTGEWQPVSLYLGDPAQGDPIVAFHASSGSDDADVSLFATWAIDDICMTSETATTPAMESFYVYLDGEPIAQGLKATTFVDNSDKEAGEHTYAVRSYNSSLQQLSDPAEITVNVHEATTNPPRNVKLTYTYDEATSKYAVQMTWDAPQGQRTPAYYTVYCNNAMFGDWIEDCSVEQTGLSKGIYDYSVVAVYSYPDGESEAVADQVALGTRYPARNLEATVGDDGNVTLVWNAPKESEYTLAGYKVFRGNQLIAQQQEASFSETNSPYGKYDYSVKAVYSDGYESLPVTAAVQNGDEPIYELPFAEDFSGGLKPGNWTVTKNRSGLKDNYLWRFDNWYELPVSGDGFDADFASTNCSSAGYTTVSTSMFTPQLVRTSITDDQRTYLEFDMDYMTGGSSYAYLAYSYDDGLSWTDLVEEFEGYTVDDLADGQTCKPQHMLIDVTELFDDNSCIRFAWTYNGKQAQHIAIDNVRVYNSSDPSTAICATATDAPLRCSIDDGVLHVRGNDIRGMKVYRADGTLVANTNGNAVRLEGSGLYVVALTTSRGTTTTKVVAK